MTLQSPASNPLQLIDGEPGSLITKARDLTESGEAMERCANRLEAISEGTTDLKSEGVDKVRESAGEVFPDLRKAAKRYTLTGAALETYGKKLDEVQGQMDNGGADAYTALTSLINDIKIAHESAETAKSTAKEKQSTVDDYDRTWIWEDDPTDEQKSTAADELTVANSALEDAEGELNKLWGHFDHRVSYWETAFDAAVEGIDNAFETADNQDKWYDHLADVLSIAGMVLFVVALVATGPLALVAAALAVVVGVVALALEIYKMSIGDGDWTSLLIAGVSILPFGKFAGKGFKFLSNAKSFKGLAKNTFSSVKSIKGFKPKLPQTFGKTKGMVRNSVGNKLPVKYTKPTGSPWNRVKTTVSNEWSKIVHPYRQRKAGREFIEGYENAFQNRQFTERFQENVVVGYKESRNHVLAGHIMSNANTAGPEAVEWAVKVQSGRTQDMISGTVDFLSGAFFNTLGTGQTVKGWG